MRSHAKDDDRLPIAPKWGPAFTVLTRDSAAVGAVTPGIVPLGVELGWWLMAMPREPYSLALL